MLKTFIERPVLASAVMMLILLAGIVGFIALPISQYPELTPPLVKVRATYPGADADTVLQAVAVPLEQRLNGTL